MREILIACVLGIVEGLTEFLPISSTGHLILVGTWLKFTGEKANVFQIFIQLGAIIAVLGYFHKRILRLLRAIFGHESTSGHPAPLTVQQARRFAAGVILAFIPAAIAGLLFYDIIEELLFNPKTVAAALIIGGLGILVIEHFRPQTKTETMEGMTWKQAFLVGVAQCLALIPGMSRSASTIMGGLIVGLNHAAAAEFSFFLAIPTISAATLFALFKSIHLLDASDILIFAIGFIVSLVVAWIVIAGFMAFIKKHSFVLFGWYRIVIGAIIFIILL